MSIIGYHRWAGKFDILENKDRAGINAKYTEPVTKLMTLNLN